MSISNATVVFEPLKGRQFFERKLLLSLKGFPMKRFVGRVSTFHASKQYGFIDHTSIRGADGADGTELTSRDIFVHQDDCGCALKENISVMFETVPDASRGGDALRAVDVDLVVHSDLVVLGEEVGGSVGFVEPQALYVPPRPAQRLAKPVPKEAVEKVLANQPMPRIPRTFSAVDDAEKTTSDLLRRIFPQLAAISETSDAEASMSDDAFDAIIASAIDDHKKLGMNAQAQHMLKMANVYKGVRGLLAQEKDLLSPHTLIPITYLPDLFMAVPVWYFWVKTERASELARIRAHNTTREEEEVGYFANLIPHDRWMNTFQMYNRQVRTLSEYQGDIIPPKIIARMKRMAGLFDHLVIMTPYHDVAGTEWDSLKWVRSVDPYVVGFTSGVPLMFMLGRFSDSGTFPLHSELVADTIDFLKSNINKLNGFNNANPKWYTTGGVEWSDRNRGTKLIKHTKELLQAFDEGNLFKWLRGEIPETSAKK